MRITITKKKGFTLVEVLVVVAITSLLAGAVLTYSSRGRTQVALYVESAKLAQVALRAKSLAIATYNNPGTPCGYGVHLDIPNNTYSLFSYSPKDANGDLNCASIVNSPIDTTDPAYSPIENFDMQKSVQFVDLPSSDNGIQEVLFVPPDPKTYIWVRGGLSQPASDITGQIELVAVNDPASVLRLRISSAGQINF